MSMFFLLDANDTSVETPLMTPAQLRGALKELAIAKEQRERVLEKIKSRALTPADTKGVWL